jgi:hypothetical protein
MDLATLGQYKKFIGGPVIFSTGLLNNTKKPLHFSIGVCRLLGVVEKMGLS